MWAEAVFWSALVDAMFCLIAGCTWGITTHVDSQTLRSWAIRLCSPTPSTASSLVICKFLHPILRHSIIFPESICKSKCVLGLVHLRSTRFDGFSPTCSLRVETLGRPKVLTTRFQSRFFRRRLIGVLLDLSST